MACKRFKSEYSNVEVLEGTRQMDIICKQIYFDTATLSETEKVSLARKQLITSLNLWRIVWKKNVRLSVTAGKQHLRLQLRDRMKRGDPSSYQETLRYVKERMSPTGKALWARMQHLQPQLWDRMKKGDPSSYREAYDYVEGNIRQISQFGMNSVNYQTLAIEYGSKRDTEIRMNDKYVFTGGRDKVSILNRWTRKTVKDLVFRGSVGDMQLNERFLVVHVHNRTEKHDQIDVYDVQKLVHIQTLETIHSSDLKIFGLGSDVVFFSEKEMQYKHLMFHVHRWNPSAARFVRDTDTEDRLKVASHVHRYTLRQIYVDDQFLIVDFAKNAIVRLIQVYSLETMQLVRERQFDDVVFKFSLKREYHDGGIVVETRSAGGQRCLALWDVVKDTIQPMADHPSQFEHSFAMSHHPFQIVMTKGENSQQLLLVQRGQPTRNGVFALPSRNCVQTPYFHSISEIFYCDGLQMLALSYQSCSKTDRRNEIVIRIADMLG